jgi:GntR family transcriptional regulator of arabinose operon
MLPKYQVIADDLRERIKNGEFPVGSIVPTEAQMQEKFGVSRQTVRQAVKTLINEGFLKSERGSGTYVLRNSDSEVTELLANAAPEKLKIGVIVTYLSDYIFPSIIRGIEKVTRANDAVMILASTNNDVEQERACLEQMKGAGIDGLIVEPTRSNLYNPNLAEYQQMIAHKRPLVMMNASYEEINVPCLRLDDEGVGEKVTNFLFEMGHEHLALITKIDDLQGKYRMKGFMNAHTKANRLFSSDAIFTYTTEDREHVLSELIHYLLEPTTNVTGIVCYNDEIGASVIRRLLYAGKKVPDDFSVTGVDNSYIARVTNLRLTSIIHPQEKMGEDAAMEVINCIRNGKELHDIVYEPELVKRASVKRLL